MFCKNCGTQLSDSAKFCGSCGMKVAAGEVKVPVNQNSRRKTKAPAKGLGKVIAIVLVIALLVGGAAALLPAVMKKTVYLQTDIAIDSPDYEVEISYEYNEDGKILCYDYSYKSEGYDGFRSSLEYEYEDGRIVSAEFKSNYDEIRMEYSYDKQGNLESVEGDDFECEVECDKEGRILEIEAEGDFHNFTMSYSYHSNGMISEREFDDNFLEERVSYNEDGKVLESEVCIDGEKSSLNEYEYNQKGQLIGVTYTTYSDGKKNSTSEETYTYNKQGSLVAFALEMKQDSQKVVVECEVVRKGDTEEYIITDLSGDAELLGTDAEKLEEDDVYMEKEYDKHGNVIRVENFATQEEEEYEYMAFKAPRGYIISRIDDPEYMRDIVNY